jgi:hypothetical protein
VVTGTRRRREIYQSVGKARERENEEMVGTNMRLAPKYYWYKRIVGAMKPLVPRNYWYY